MSWVRLDDKRALNPKLMAAGFAARGLDEAAICLSSLQGTDGRVSRDMLATLTGSHGERFIHRLAKKLVTVGRWEVDGDSWLIHDYLEYNPSHMEAEAAREAKAQVRAAAGRLGGLRSGQVRRSKTEANGNQVASKQTGSKMLELQQANVNPRPDPSRNALNPCLPSLHHPPVSRANGSKGEEDDELATKVKIEQAVRLVAERRLAATPSKVLDKAAWLRTTVASIPVEPDLAFEVGLSVERLADRIDPPKRDPFDATRAAAEAIYARNDAAPCPACDGAGWADDGAVSNTVIRCGACGGTGRAAQ